MTRLVPLLAASALLFACSDSDPVSDSGANDASSGGDTAGDDSPTSGSPTGDPTTDTPTSSDGEDTTPATDDSGATTDPPDDDTGSDSDTGTTTGAGEAGYCASSCKDAADCCALGAIDCPSETYPNNWECNEGVCEFGGCTTNNDCSGVLTPDDSCHEVSGVGVCYDPCAEDNDCPDGLTCTGEGDDGTNFCTAEPEPCKDDSDCGGFGVCDTDSGECVCESDANCTADGGDVCVLP